MNADPEPGSASHSCCGSQHRDQPVAVAAAQSHQLRKKYFCQMCEGGESDTPGTCARCGMTLQRNPAVLEHKKIIYTCPMHPQIEQDRPGNCPICGMTLEPKTIGAEDGEEQREVGSLSRKFWTALVLTIPVLILAMGHAVPGLSVDAVVPRQVRKWIEFGLTTPVVFWAGGFFFTRAWQSLVNRSLNMFTLIGVGVGAAYLFSAVAVIAPGIFLESFRLYSVV